MTGPQQLPLRPLLFGILILFTLNGYSQLPPPPPSPNTARLTPPLPQAQSPVTFFRQLLLMAPGERMQSLTNRTPEMRARIMTKVQEYQKLSPEDRELRLKATDLRWHLTVLLRLPPEERAGRVEMVPEDLRDLVKARLKQWDLLPPPLQQEFLANDHTLHYFARVDSTNPPTATAEQQKITEQFNQFFELTPQEKTKALNTLSPVERAQMEKTLQTFEQLPPQQRLQCLHNYAKFASLTAAERSDFLKHADSWSKMSPAERQTWRDLVRHVPQWPPLPPSTVPASLIPRGTPRVPHTSMATN
jgi:hypothetical protein